MEHERAPTTRPLHPALANQLAERPPDGDQAAPVARRQVALGRKTIAGAPLGVVEGGLQVQVDLVAQRDGAELESETGHRRAGDLGRGSMIPGLRGRRLLITL